MSYIFPEIKTQHDHIQKVIKGEEESFNATLDRGLEIFEEETGKLGSSKIFSGEAAFKLYDTFGFPIDLTELLASERGLTVDVETFNTLMEGQKERSRTSGKDTAYATLKFSAESVKSTKTEFLGYSAFEADATVVDLVNGYAVLDKTPFYAESGGQVGDHGVLIADEKTVVVTDTQKDGTVFGHKIEGDGLTIGQHVKAKVDLERRLAIMRNHSATHLLHGALRQVLGTHVHQAGSFVSPEYLRFDFAHFAKVTDIELQHIEAIVNKQIQKQIARTQGLNNIPFEKAKTMGALMFFGDKYGDFVNVIQFGDFSTEFCGGTHVNNTGDIQYFKIRSEGSVASGVRRIEAVTGNYTVTLLIEQEREFFKRIDAALAQIDELNVLHTEIIALESDTDTPAHYPVNGFVLSLESLKQLTPVPKQASSELAVCFTQLHERQEMLDEIVSQIAETKKSIEKEIAKSRLQSLSGSMDDLVASAQSLNDVKVVIARVTAASADELKSLGDSLRSKLGNGIGLLATVIDEKVQLVCVVTDDLVKAKKAEAGKIVGAIAKLLGGGGGGRPHMATAGGKDIAKLDEVLKQAPSIIQSFLKS
jgi:alanyl-tRNA synthetase